MATSSTGDDAFGVSDDRQSTRGGSTCNGVIRSDVRSLTNGSADCELRDPTTGDNVSSITEVTSTGGSHCCPTECLQPSNTSKVSHSLSIPRLPLRFFGSPLQRTVSDRLPAVVTSPHTDAVNQAIARCCESHRRCHYSCSGMTVTWRPDVAMTSSTDRLPQSRCHVESCEIDNLVKLRVSAFDDRETCTGITRGMAQNLSRGTDFLLSNGDQFIKTMTPASPLRLLHRVPLPTPVNRFDVATVNDVPRAADLMTLPATSSPPKAPSPFFRQQMTSPQPSRFDEPQDQMFAGSVLDFGTRLSLVGDYAYEKPRYAECRNAPSQSSENGRLKYSTNEVHHSGGIFARIPDGVLQLPATEHRMPSQSTSLDECRLQLVNPFSSLTEMYDVLLQRIAARCSASLASRHRHAAMASEEVVVSAAARSGRVVAGAEHLSVRSCERRHTDGDKRPTPTSTTTSATRTALFRPYLDLSPSSSSSDGNRYVTDDNNVQRSAPNDGRKSSSSSLLLLSSSCHVPRERNSTALYLHTRPHAKKYRCDVCGRTFSRSNTLVTHRVS